MGQIKVENAEDEADEKLATASEVHRVTRDLSSLAARGGRSVNRRMVVFVFVSLVFVISMALGSPASDSQTINIMIYAHLSIPVLATGIAVLPLNMGMLAFIPYFLGFLLVELIVVGFSGSTGWTALGMVKALAASGTIGLFAGSLARSMHFRDGPRGSRNFPERTALICGLLVVAVGLPLGVVSLWLELHAVMKPEDLHAMIMVLGHRVLRLGMITTAACLLLRAMPEVRELREVMLHGAIFLAAALLARAGYYVTDTADPAILGLALIFLRPIRIAVAGVLTGICLYVPVTGIYLELVYGAGRPVGNEQLLADILFVILVMVAATRMRAERIERSQMQTLGRMARAQELARYGHFVYETRQKTLKFDRLSQGILGVPAFDAPEALLARVHPDDHDRVQAALCRSTPEGMSVPFRLCDGAAWAEDAAVRHLTVFSLREQAGTGAPLAYGIIVDVTELHAQEEHLKRVLAELSEKQGFQTQLFSMISHELRTPASIMSMLADQLDEGESWESCGPKMRAVMDQLLSVLSDMRQTVRPEQNLPVSITAFPPADLLRDVAGMFEPLASARGITLRLDPGEGAQDLRSTDRVRLNQTLSNLVKNAIVHSQATEITLGFALEGEDTGVFTVSDNGRNIPPAQQSKLFQPFSRSSPQAMQADGSGLGLYIAKVAMELLGGSLRYVERPMSGAMFQVRLPMPRPAEDATVQGMSPPVTALPDLSRLSVLVLEDSETMGELLVSRMARVFGHIHWLRDGETGLAWMAENPVDVVMTDLYMPGMTGDEVARNLRARGFDKPIIGMTAADLGEDVERFRQSGATRVLTKPVRPQDVIAALS